MSKTAERDLTRITRGVVIVLLNARHPFRWGIGEKVANAEHMADIIRLVCKGTNRTVFMPYLCPTNPFYAPLFSRIEHLPICWCHL